MADPYNFSFDVAAFLEEQEAADTSVAPKEGVMKKPEAPVEEAPMPITEKLKKRLADTVQGFYNSTQEIRDRYNKAQETNPLLGRDAAQNEWMTALSAPAVTAAELGPTMSTLAMQDAQEQAAMRSASGITESLGRSVTPAGLGNAPAQPETPVIYEAAATVTNGRDSVVDRTAPAGLMTRPAETPSSFTVPEFKSYASAEEMSDLEILARTIEAEASGESFKGKIAVGSVIANRVASGSYGGSGGIKGVILKKGQFSPWNSYTNYAKGEQGKDMLNFKASEESYKAANDILTGNYTDETGGASHYVNPKVSTPNWLPDMKARKRGTVTIGNHLFGNADNEKVYDGKSGIAELSSETTDQPLVAQAPTVKAIQRIVGTSADGQFGPASRKKALSYLANEGVEVPKDATNKQLMDLVINRPKAPLTPNISLPKVEESTTTEAVLDVVSQSVPQEVLYNPLAYIKKNNLIGLDERTPEGAKAIDGFFKTATPQGLDALKMKGGNVSSTKNAWCAVFVDHVLRTMGAPALDPATSPRGMKEKKQRRYAAMRAFEYANYGDAVKTDQLQAGDLVIMKESHIGFYTGEKDAKGNYLVLGGNQSTKGSFGRGVSVNVAPYPLSDVKEIRRITDVANLPADEIKAMTTTITGTDEAAGEGS